LEFGERVLCDISGYGGGTVVAADRTASCPSSPHGDSNDTVLFWPVLSDI